MVVVFLDELVDEAAVLKVITGSFTLMVKVLLDPASLNIVNLISSLESTIEKRAGASKTLISDPDTQNCNVN